MLIYFVLVVEDMNILKIVNIILLKNIPIFGLILDFNHSVKIGNGIISHFTAKNVDKIRVVYQSI